MPCHPRGTALPVPLACLILALILPFTACHTADPAAQRLEAQRLREAGAAAESAAMLEGLLERSPGDFQLQYDLALAWHEAGDDERAIRVVSGAVAADPASQDARWLRGAVLADLGRDQEALAELRQVVAADPRRPSVHRIMGLVHLRAGRQQRATNQFEKELAVNPADPVALTESGILSLKAGNMPLAAERLQRAVQEAPDVARAHRFLAEVLFRLSRHDEGLAAQRRAFELDPSDVDLLLDHARALH